MTETREEESALRKHKISIFDKEKYNDDVTLDEKNQTFLRLETLWCWNYFSVIIRLRLKKNFSKSFKTDLSLI